MVAAIRNNVQRWFEQWGPLLDLGETRRRPYVSSGLVAIGARARSRGPAADGREPGPGRLRAHLLARATSPITRSSTPTRTCSTRSSRRGWSPAGSSPSTSGSPRSPRSGASRRSTTRRSAAPIRTGSSRLVAHFILPAKPWQRPMYHGVYSRAPQARCSSDPGSRSSFPPSSSRFASATAPRPGSSGPGSIARDRLGWRVRELIPQALLDRLDDSRRERAAAR